MKSFALNSANDLIIENGQIVTTQGAEYVLQKVRSRLLFYRGEWFLRRDHGVPYFEEVFTKPANPANVESILKETIVRTPGVRRLIEFSLNFDRATRHLSVEFSAETSYGSIDREKVVINV